MAEFRSDKVNENITIMQNVKGLTYGTDAYLLYAFMNRAPKKVAVELGAGTGIISLLSLKSDKFAKVHAVEIQHDFAELVAINAAQNDLSDRLSVIECDVRELTQNLTYGSCDAVFTNPPYFKSDSGKHNSTAEMDIARREIFGGISDFCKCASRLLKHGGAFYVVYRADRIAELVCSMRNAKIEPKRLCVVYPDTKSKPCLVLCEGRMGSGEGVFFTKPLFLYEDASVTPQKRTLELEKIYESGEFDESYRKP